MQAIVFIIWMSIKDNNHIMLMKQKVWEELYIPLIWPVDNIGKVECENDGLVDAKIMKLCVKELTLNSDGFE
jgi:hypothetical protein